MDEARQELHKIINDPEMKNAIILVLANKQDQPSGIIYIHLTNIFDNACLEM